MSLGTTGSSSGATLVPFVRISPKPCGKYTLLAKLGHGGMAEVFLAIAGGMAGFRKLVVIKRLHPQLLDEPDFVQMLLDEARLAARLSHPNVVQTVEVGEDRGVPFIAMEYLEGQNLERVVRAGRRFGDPMPAELVVRVLADALAGLNYAHTLKNYDGTPLGVVHRDVSPANVFVTYHGSVKILDFGIAKASTKIVVTRVGTIKGKFSYMAPEQAAGGKVDARADLWSMGVLLWESLTGKRIFKAETDVKTLEFILTSDIRSRINDAKDLIPPALLAIVERALRRDPKKRYASAAEMQAELEAYLVALGRPVGNQDLSAYISRVFGEVIEQHHSALGELVSRSEGAVDAPSSDDFNVVSMPTPPRTTPARTFTEGAATNDYAPARAWRTYVAGATIIAAAIASFFIALNTSPPTMTDAGSHRAAPVASSPPETARSSGATTATETQPLAPQPARAALVTPPTDAGVAAVAQRTRSRRNRAVATRAHEPAATTTTRVPSPPETPANQPTGESGYLTLDTRPWVEVFISGRSLGTTPLLREQLPAGVHVLTLRNSERRISMQYVVTIRPGATVTRRLGLQ